MATIPPRRLRVLVALDAHIVRHRFSPTIRELADAVGIASLNGVADHLGRLIDQGFVARGEARQARTLTVTPLGRRAVDEHLRAVADGLPLESALVAAPQPRRATRAS
jgi:SOS-response transcriptional repressor LexA